MRRMSKARLLALAAMALLVGPGCFEDGPLGAFVNAPDTDEDTGPDIEDTGPEIEEVDVDEDAPPMCSGEADCAGMVPEDLCLGEIRCLEGRCVVDPTTATTCPEPSHPCREAVCDPVTAECSEVSACACQPRDSLQCGKTLSWSSADSGVTSTQKGYDCGPPGGTGTEHTFTFEATEDTPVTVIATADALAGVYVVGWDGQTCDPAVCVAGGTSAATWDAVTGTTYGIVVEHAPGGLVLIDLETKCGLQSETLCSDGLDDDGDGATDCDDDDCAETVECLQTCTPTGDVLSCGDNQSGDTSGQSTLTTDYVCGDPPTNLALAGQELAYTFESDQAGEVTINLSSVILALQVSVLQDKGQGCTPKDCVATGDSTVTFTNEPGTTYYIVVDATQGDSGPFELGISCP